MEYGSLASPVRLRIPDVAERAVQPDAKILHLRRVTAHSEAPNLAIGHVGLVAILPRSPPLARPAIPARIPPPGPATARPAAADDGKSRPTALVGDSTITVGGATDHYA
jgi:hypothetical protein